MRVLIGFVALVGFTAAALAQTPAPSTPPASPPAASAVKPDTKPVDCSAQAKSKGLSGQAARDSVALCRQELRTACLKEAIDKKIDGKKERRDFIKTCSARPKGGSKS